MTTLRWFVQRTRAGARVSLGREEGRIAKPPAAGKIADVLAGPQARGASKGRPAKEISSALLVLACKRRSRSASSCSNRLRPNVDTGDGQARENRSLLR